VSERSAPSCPSVSELEWFLDDPDGAAAALASHIEHCAACEAELRDLRANRELAERLRASKRSASASHDASRSSRASTPIVSGYDLLDDGQRGGQGVVYRARQQATSRAVALKVLTGGAFATDRQRRRFEREIELVAALDHPNIVTVYDSGTTGDDRPYFTMQYIDGVPLDAWAAAMRASHQPPHVIVRAMLELFGKVCDGVSFAHQHGVIHRDLKPGNILVASPALPTILDFGLAKPIFDDPASSDLRNVTDPGGGFLGTLAYASPEQTRRDPAQIDVRTDVYALGVILFEMLTGELPFTLEGDLASVIRSIEHDDPPRPSARCGASPIRRAVNDEIDRIVLKALAKDRDRRYRSAGALRDDIARYLNGEAIEAKADSRWYIARKMLARHRIALAVATAFLLLLAGAAVALLIMYQHARSEAEKVTQINLFLEDTLGSVAPSHTGADVTVRDLLDEAARWIDIALADQPEIEASIRTIVGNSYRNLGAFDEAELHLDRALQIRRRLFGARHPDIAHSLSELALLRRDQGRREEAESLFRTALEMRRTSLGDDSPEVAYTLANLGLLRRDRGDADEAERLLQESFDIRTRLFGASHPDVAMCVHHLATVAEARGNLEEALRLHRDALTMRQSVLHRHHPDVARSMADVGRMLMLLHRPDEARPFLEAGLALRAESFGANHPETVELRTMLDRLKRE